MNTNDQYIEIEHRISSKLETMEEDIFLTYFLDSGLYEKFYIEAQVPFYEKGIYKYRADFVLISKYGKGRMIVEIDGGHHQFDHKQKKYDKRRDKYFKKLGYEVLRLSNKAVRTELSQIRFEL